ncbi:MAG: TraR/DksA family transcriptional regulator [Acidimicrobiia bacterium]
MVTKLSPVEAHRQRLEELRATSVERLARLRADYDELAEVGEDVGAGEDEGGSQGDGTFVERDRLRALAAEETATIEAVDAALARAEGDDWATCTGCGQPIGDDRLEFLPTTDVCVACKARTSRY